MIDSVIAGTGNSRFLRTSISASTTWEDALTMLRAGTFPIDLAGINIDGYITVGTPLNAETLLKEAVIEALDLDDNATPSDAWEKLIAIVNTKADADSVVTAITYDSEEKKLYATIDGTPTLVTTFNFTTPQEAADAAPVQSVAGRTGNVALTKSDVGLGNVDNTSDADKPISTATQTALNAKQDTLTFDTTPTSGSTNPVTSGGIYTAVSQLERDIDQTVAKYHALPELNDLEAAWVQGGIANKGGYDTSSDVLIRKAGYLDNIICYAEVDTGYMFRIYIYDGNTYVGYFLSDGTVSNAASGTAYLTGSFDMRPYKKAHPTYKYRVTMANTAATAISTSAYGNLHFGCWDYDVDRMEEYARCYPVLCFKTIAGATGVESNANYRLATDVLNGDEIIHARIGFFYIYGYKQYGTYEGVWNGTAFVKSGFQNCEFREIDLGTLSQENKYRIVFAPKGTATQPLTRAEMDWIQFSRPAVKAEAGVFDKITIAEWNIGHFSLGGSTGTAITQDDYAEKREAFRQLINSVGADVLMLPEYSATFANVSGTAVSAKTDLFGNYLHSFIGSQLRYSCNAMYFNIPIFGLSDVDYECNQDAVITHTSAILATDYRYMHGIMNLAGNTVHIIGTHCAFDLNNADVETDQYDELIELTKNYAHVIILGDMNAVHDSNEFDAFIGAGFTPINHGYLGDMNTYTGSQSVPNRAIDNIMVRGLAVTKIEKVQTELSDHDLIKCELSIA